MLRTFFTRTVLKGKLDTPWALQEHSKATPRVLGHSGTRRAFGYWGTRNARGTLFRWYTNPRVTSYELRINILASCVYCTSYELQVIFITPVTSYFLHTSYELLFIVRVTSYFLHTSYELLFITRVTSYFCCTSYELLFIARVTSYCLLHELRVTFCIRVRG